MYVRPNCMALQKIFCEKKRLKIFEIRNNKLFKLLQSKPVSLSLFYVSLKNANIEEKTAA